MQFEAAHRELLTACEGGRFDAAEDFLRWGLHPDIGHCGPPDYSILSRANWLRLERVPLDPDERGAGFEPTFAGLASSSGEIAILIGTNGHDDVSVNLGVVGPREVKDWIRALSAPQVVYADLENTPSCGSALRSTFLGGVIFRLTPAAEAREWTGAAASLLQRMLVVTGTSWALLVHARAIGMSSTDQQIAAFEECGQAAAEHGVRTDRESELVSIQVENLAAERVTRWLEVTTEQLRLGRSIGAWSVTIHLAAMSEGTAGVLLGAVATALPDEGVGPVRWLADRVPCQASGPPPDSLLTSRDLSRILMPPNRSLGPLLVVEPLPASRRIVTPDRPIPIGNWIGVDTPAALDVRDLEGHAFVSGLTGTGKSTTVSKLLVSLWNDHQIPFLVIDPVKADYGHLDDVLHGGLATLNARDLRLNALAPWPGFDPVTHLGLITTAFKGSFSMPSPIPYVVTQLFDRLEERVNWQPYPTLHDVRADVDDLVRSLGYGSELEANIRGALGTRLAVLLAPSRAERVAALDNTQLTNLLPHPLAVQLSDLGDDEERAFVVTLLTLLVAESARVRGRASDLAHVTVLEEAHRILPEPRHASEEIGDPSSVAARMLTQLLAEIRSYGESLIVIDQSPAAVARDALRNTNLKLSHRIVDPDDRETIAGSLGMEPRESGVIARLAVGEALVASRHMVQPQALRIDAKLGNKPSDHVSHRAITSSQKERPCCDTEVAGVAHHIAERAAREAEGSMALLLAAELVGSAANRPRALRLVVTQIGRLAARYTGAQQSCLAYVGIRQALISNARLGRLRGEDLGTHLGYAYAQWMKGQPMPLLTKSIRHFASADDGPYEGCNFCMSPCLLRHFGQTGAMGRSLHLRQRLEREIRGHSDLMASWMKATSTRFATVFGERAGRDAALCACVHAARDAHIADYSVGDAWLAAREAIHGSG